MYILVLHVHRAALTQRCLNVSTRLGLLYIQCTSVHVRLLSPQNGFLSYKVLDELLPKATGREARLEKKRIRSEQRREREISPGVCTKCVHCVHRVHVCLLPKSCKAEIWFIHLFIA